MDLPNELIFNQLLYLPHKDLIKMCKTDQRIKSLCDKNEEYIYKNLSQRELGIIPNAKLFYHFINSDKLIYFTKRLIEKGDIDTLVSLGLLNYKMGPLGVTPLDFAILDRQTSSVYKLLNVGADVNIIKKDKTSIVTSIFHGASKHWNERSDIVDKILPKLKPTTIQRKDLEQARNYSNELPGFTAKLIELAPKLASQISGWPDWAQRYIEKVGGQTERKISKSSRR